MDAIALVTTDVPPSSGILILGTLLLIGWFAHAVGSFTHVPRVTVLLLFGVAAGPSFLDLIPSDVAAWFPHITHLALAMIGFLLGESFAGRDIKISGRTVVAISLGETFGAALAVFACVLLIQGDFVVALLLAGIAPATAPAATMDVIREMNAKGPLTKTLLGVVAVDDAWGVILFSLLLVIVEGVVGGGALLIEITQGLWEVLGGVLLGIIIGLPMAWFTGRIKKGEPSLVEAAGFVFICGGLALALNVSYLLACIVLGATVANRAKHHSRPFREIEGASDPFLVMFFMLAGYEFNITAFKAIGAIAIVYVLARSVGLIIGGGMSARLANAPSVIQSHIGWCLLPQAGVALGLALLVSERLPNVGEIILPLILATTIVFELIGPLITRWHLRKAGEI
jgi:Kef-type K+ transport system membrane component KefB